MLPWIKTVTNNVKCKKVYISLNLNITTNKSGARGPGW